MAIPAINVLGNPNVTEGNFQIAIEDLRKSVIGSGKAYDSANTYSQYDTCIYNGVEYYSKINSNIGNTPSIGTNWGLVSELIKLIASPTTNSLAKINADGTIGNSNIINDANGSLTINSGALRGSHGGGNIATNFAAGDSALVSNTTGNYNTANGVNALLSNTTGNYNTASGVSALLSNTTFSNVSGFGYNSQVTGSNQVQLGDSATTTYVYGTVQNRSDLRDKADVRDTVLGLDFIKSLRPVDYKWDMREDYKTERPVAHDIEKPAEDDIEALAEYNRIQDEYKLEVEKWLEDNKLENIVNDGSKKRVRYHQGFIAQEVQALGVEFGGIQDHSIKGGEDVLSIGYDEMIAPLVKAVQEQQAMIDILKSRIETLEEIGGTV